MSVAQPVYFAWEDPYDGYRSVPYVRGDRCAHKPASRSSHTCEQPMLMVDTTWDERGSSTDPRRWCKRTVDSNGKGRCHGRFRCGLNTTRWVGVGSKIQRSAGSHHPGPEGGTQKIHPIVTVPDRVPRRGTLDLGAHQGKGLVAHDTCPWQRETHYDTAGESGRSRSQKRTRTATCG